MVFISTPSDIDILCAKDKTYSKHPGNLKYRELIEEHAQSYTNESSKQIKMKVTKHIVEHLEALGARFLRRIQGQDVCWEEITTQEARDKISHALRFCAGNMLLGKKPSVILRASSTEPPATPPPGPSTTTLPPPKSILRGTKRGTVIVVKKKQQEKAQKPGAAAVVVVVAPPPVNKQGMAVVKRQKAKRTVLEAIRQHRRIVSNDFSSADHPFSHRNMAALSYYHHPNHHHHHQQEQEQLQKQEEPQQRSPSPITMNDPHSDLWFSRIPTMTLSSPPTPLNVPCSDLLFSSRNHIYEEYEETTINDDLSEYNNHDEPQPYPHHDEHHHHGSAYERALVNGPSLPDHVASTFYDDDDTIDHHTTGVVNDLDDLFMEPLGAVEPMVVVSRGEFWRSFYSE